MENAWICFSFCLDEAQFCKRAMHFVRMCGDGFCGVVEIKVENLKRGEWFLGVWKIKESFEDTFICVSCSVSEHTKWQATEEIELPQKIRFKFKEPN